MSNISKKELIELYNALSPLIGIKIDCLSIPPEALNGFEPSQIAVIINTLLDAILPQIDSLQSDPDNRQKLEHLGLSKSPRQIGERESYPDYIHISGKRVELKGLFVDNPELKLKRPPTPREPSARVKENITGDVVNPETDVLLLAAVELKEEGGRCYPFIKDIGIFPMFEVINARDKRLNDCGGKWFGKVPKVVKDTSMKKYRNGEKLDDDDYEKDTNFGKLKRIPYAPLQKFLEKYKLLKEDSECDK